MEGPSMSPYVGTRVTYVTLIISPIHKRQPDHAWATMTWNWKLTNLITAATNTVAGLNLSNDNNNNNSDNNRSSNNFSNNFGNKNRNNASDKDPFKNNPLMNSPPADLNYISPASDNDDDSDGSVMDDVAELVGPRGSAPATVAPMMVERTMSAPAPISGISGLGGGVGGSSSQPASKRRLPGGGMFQSGSSRDSKTRRRDEPRGSKSQQSQQSQQQQSQGQQGQMWDKEGKRGDKEEFVDQHVVEWLRKGKNAPPLSRFLFLSLFLCGKPR